MSRHWTLLTYHCLRSQLLHWCQLRCHCRFLFLCGTDFPIIFCEAMDMHLLIFECCLVLVCDVLCIASLNHVRGCIINIIIMSCHVMSSRLSCHHYKVTRTCFQCRMGTNIAILDILLQGCLLKVRCTIKRRLRQSLMDLFAQVRPNEFTLGWSILLCFLNWIRYFSIYVHMLLTRASAVTAQSCFPSYHIAIVRTRLVLASVYGWIS